MVRTILVIPCFNEARRLPTSAIRDFLTAHPDVGIQFVDDGSTDETLLVLEDLRPAFPDRIWILRLEHNSGKAEAVRQGMLAAAKAGPVYAGFWDADLATPLSVLPQFIARMDERSSLDVVLGSRVQLLGRHIHRSLMRHYLGRIFATTVSLLLNVRVYDTQCGAKLFRANNAMKALFETPFQSKWIFDVELLARFFRDRQQTGLNPLEAIYEEPLPEWRDVEGSKVRGRHFVTAFFDLLRIYSAYRPQR